jgi:hypothetical protein
VTRADFIRVSLALVIGPGTLGALVAYTLHLAFPGIIGG